MRTLIDTLRVAILALAAEPQETHIKVWQCDECGTIFFTPEGARECSDECQRRARGKDNVPRWNKYCAVIDDTFALPGTVPATELLADYICDYLEEDDRDTGPSNRSIDTARRIAEGAIPMSEVIESVKSLRR